MSVVVSSGIVISVGVVLLLAPSTLFSVCFSVGSIATLLL